MGIVKRDGFKLTIIAWAGILLGYVNKIILFPKFLDPEQVGLANILIAVAALFAQFSSLGTLTVLWKFFPYFKDHQNKHYGLLTWVFKLTGIGSLLTTLVLIAFHNPIAAFYSERSPLLVHYYYYLIPLGLSVLSYQIFDAYLRSQMDTVFASFAWEILLRLAVTVSITLYALDYLNFEQFVIVYVIANFAASFAVYIYTFRKKIFYIPRIHTKVRRYRKHLYIFAFFSLLSGAGNNFMATIDQIFIAGFVDLRATGIFTTVAFVTSVIIVPYRAVIKVTSPIVAELWQKKDLPALEKLYKSTSVSMMVVSCYLFSGIWVCIDELFNLMPKGDIFREGKYVFLILCIGRLFDMASGINGVIILTSKKYRYDLFFTLFLIIGTLISNYIFIRILNWGINGAAVATAATLVVYNVMRLFFIYYHYRMQPFSLKFFFGIAVFLACLFITMQLPAFHNNILGIFVKGATLTVLYSAAVYFFRISDDINSVANKFLVRWRILKKIP
jgi:O-antigen/teichoic acid export membrane protein